MGHTHEDIDGIFGRISQAIVNKHVLTPQSYETNIKSALPNCEVIDIFIIPNYTEFFAACIDKNVGRMYKTIHAKLQFTLEAVDVDTRRYSNHTRELLRVMFKSC